jgi:hypothetical protein
MTDSDEIKELRYFNTPTEPIHITGLPLNEIPPDTPNYLTDRTYVDIIQGFNKARKTAKLIHFWCITIAQTRSYCGLQRQTDARGCDSSDYLHLTKAKVSASECGNK